MASAVPNQPAPDIKPQVIIPSSFNPFKPIAVPAVVILVLLILLALNYFNIIPLSELYPKQLGFLPHQIRSIPLQKPASLPTPSPIPLLILACPVAEEFCQQAKIVDNDTFYGIYFNLTLNTPLLAVFAGQLSDEPKVPKRLATQPLVYLRDNQNLEAIYSFFGSSNIAKSKNYLPGQEIGKIGKGNFPSIVPFGGSNFVLSVKKDDKFIKFSLK